MAIHFGDFRKKTRFQVCFEANFFNSPAHLALGGDRKDVSAVFETCH